MNSIIMKICLIYAFKTKQVLIKRLDYAMKGVHGKSETEWNGMEWNEKYSMEYKQHGMEYK
jgi:hypothetical protein